MIKINIKSQDLLDEDIIDSDQVISDKIVGHRRWSVDHEIIFKWKDGKVYKAYYSSAATEGQDESPWEYDDKVECIEMEQKEVKRLEWVNKE